MSLILFLALFVLSLGLGFILKAVINTDFPMFRWVLGSLIVLLGVHFLVNNLTNSEQHVSYKVLFSDRNIVVDTTENSKIEVVFGHSAIDLQDYELNDSLPKVAISVIFGHADVYLPENVPFIVETDMGFAGTTGLKSASGGFGQHYYSSSSFLRDKNYLTIDVTVVFGAVDFH